MSDAINNHDRNLRNSPMIDVDFARFSSGGETPLPLVENDEVHDYKSDWKTVDTNPLKTEWPAKLAGLQSSMRSSLSAMSEFATEVASGVANHAGKLIPAGSLVGKNYVEFRFEDGVNEATISARDSTNIPFFVPKNKAIAWKVMVQAYDLGFQVKLREQAEGGAIERELEPMLKVSAEELCVGGRRAVDFDRYMVLIFDNTYSLLRSKTYLYQVLTGDAAVAALEEAQNSADEIELQLEEDRKASNADPSINAGGNQTSGGFEHARKTGLATVRYVNDGISTVLSSVVIKAQSASKAVSGNIQSSSYFKGIFQKNQSDELQPVHSPADNDSSGMSMYSPADIDERQPVENLSGKVEVQTPYFSPFLSLANVSTPQFTPFLSMITKEQSKPPQDLMVFTPDSESIANSNTANIGDINRARNVQFYNPADFAPSGTSTSEKISSIKIDHSVTEDIPTKATSATSTTFTDINDKAITIVYNKDLIAGPTLPPNQTASHFENFPTPGSTVLPNQPPANVENYSTTGPTAVPIQSEAHIESLPSHQLATSSSNGSDINIITSQVANLTAESTIASSNSVTNGNSIFENKQEVVAAIETNLAEDI